MCRGIPETEVSTIKQGLQIEKGFFFLSRLYVPLTFFSLYKRGVFSESFTFGEFKYIARVVLMMYAIDAVGHLLMKQWTKGLYEKHIGIDEDYMYKKSMQDYIV